MKSNKIVLLNLNFGLVLPDSSSQEYINTSLSSPPPPTTIFNSSKGELEPMISTRYTDNNAYCPNNWSSAYNNNYYNPTYNQQQYPPVVSIVRNQTLFKGQNSYNLLIHVCCGIIYYNICDKYCWRSSSAFNFSQTKLQT